MANATTSGNISSKRRRTPGSCDLCKKRKIKCDSGGVAGQRCTNCMNAGAECTHVELTKNLGSAKGYVSGLEQRLEKMETLLQKLLPGVDITKELENGIDCPHDEAEELPRNDASLSMGFENLKLDPSRKRFFGRSSGLYLVETALHHKQHHVGESYAKPPEILNQRRESVWDPKDWQMRYLQYPQPQYEFPPDDLLPSLVDLYFENVNIVLPLLHRPTFENAIAEGVHRSDPFFGGTVLLVCALAAKYSEDPRVFSEGPEVPASAGWHYYVQVPIVRTHLQLSVKPSLHEIQCYALGVVYIKATTEQGQNDIRIISAASRHVYAFNRLRLAQDVGAHRTRNLPHPNVMDELWKRAFFLLLTHERSIGSFAGRPSTIHEEEYDVDFPVDCDDEYWDQPNLDSNFKQPAGMPSKVSYFIHYLKLMDILAYSMRAIYPIRQTKLISGRPIIKPTQLLIAELDSLLNQWLDAMPVHLKWDPNRRGPFFKQSAMLYSNYYNLQCFIHRPFIPMPQHPSSSSFPSLTMCVTAARACSHVAMAMVQQNIVLPFPHSSMCFFTAAVVLLLSTWTRRHSGVTSANIDAISGVDACLKTFKMCETRWPSAGRFWDMITDMARVGETVPVTNNKRPRSSEDLHGQVQQSSIDNDQNRRSPSSYLVFHDPRDPIHGPHNFGPQSKFGNEAIQSFDLGSFLNTTTSQGSSSEDSVVYTPRNLFEDPFSTLGPPNFTMSNACLNESTSVGADATSQPEVNFDFDTFLASLPNSMDDATLSMWSATPPGYEADDWKVYLSNLQGTGVLDGIVNQQTW
ncbi:putative fungal-specific transcription factor [Lentinula boryana]|uniref:Fungal-specific transcription factor n=1 Tax=Lentinula boryana TaxID=40481 RepID=A0ABQ8QKX3_9AGAR|nr:putative fungal-specific transcription factor [Lentinula boryana]